MSETQSETVTLSQKEIETIFFDWYIDLQNDPGKFTDMAEYDAQSYAVDCADYFTASAKRLRDMPEPTK